MSEIAEIAEIAEEAVLVVPLRLTKSAYKILLDAGVVPRPWHVAGRYGSRTHRYNEESMGIPLLFHLLEEKLPLIHTEHSKSLQELLRTPGVKLIHKPMVVSNRVPKLQGIEATVHPERKPTCITSTGNVKLPQTQAQFTFAELFAGIGGFGIALEALGGQCVFCSELLERCREVYQQNSSNTVMHGDIYQVTNKMFPTSVDILVAGFPCQPFSALGKQPGLKDVQQRGVLFLEIVRFLKVVQPKAFLLENVPGLLQLKDDYETIVHALEEVGYQVKTEVVSARCVTATSRKRLLFVGLLKKGPCDNISEEFQFPYIPDLGLRAGHIMEYEQYDPLFELTNIQMNQLATPKSKWKPARLAWDNVVCETLDSHYGVCVGKGNSQLVPTTEGRPRRMSPRECASIMGFPTSFQLLKWKQPNQGDMAFIKEQYRMIGNAVCPPLMAAVAGAVLERALGEVGWEEHGRMTCMQLALQAIRPCWREETQNQWKQEFPCLRL